jgi:hypothetical protein
MTGYGLMAGGRVTQQAAEVAVLLWPRLERDTLTEVSLSDVAAQSGHPLYHARTLVVQLMNAGVVAGNIGESVGRLRRDRGRLVVVRTLCDTDCAPLKVFSLDGPSVVREPPESVETASVTPKRVVDEPRLTTAEFELARLIWYLSKEKALPPTRRHILEAATAHGHKEGKIRRMLTILTRSRVLSASRGNNARFCLRAEGALCVSGGEVTYRRYDDVAV